VLYKSLLLALRSKIDPYRSDPDNIKIDLVDIHFEPFRMKTERQVTITDPNGKKLDWVDTKIDWGY